MERVLGNFDVLNGEGTPVAPIFQKETLEFHGELSDVLMSNIRSRALPEEYIQYALWCRKRSLEREQKRIPGNEIRYGRGMSLHIPPKNVPITALFSYSFGLLSGNSVCVRIPSKSSETLTAGIDLIKRVLKNHSAINVRTAFVKYNRNENWSEEISAVSDTRVIWGGDRTVGDFRKLKTKSSCVDIFFPDKTSLTLVDAEYLAGIEDEESKALGYKLAKDIFTYDQQACSSPRLLIIHGNISQYIYKPRLYKLLEEVDKASRRIKSYLYSQHLEHFKGASRLWISGIIDEGYIGTYLCGIWIRSVNEISLLKHEPGIIGLIHIDSLQDLARCCPENLQTVVYVGETDRVPEPILDALSTLPVTRVVNPGRAINMHLRWDGHDIIRVLSKELYSE